MKNLAVYFANIQEKNLPDWALLHEKLISIFDNVCFILDFKDDVNLFQTDRIETIVRDPRSCKKSKQIEKDFLNFFNKNSDIENLIEHPFLKHHNRSITGLLKKFFTSFRRKYLLQEYSNWQIILKNRNITHVLVMEPRNFLYTPSLIILEKICQCSAIDFALVHHSFLLNNIKVFNNLRRHESGIFEKYREIVLSESDVISVKSYMENYKIFQKESLYKYLYRDKQGVYRFSEINKTPYILWMVSKDNNYRAHYVSPNWNILDIIDKVSQNIPRGFDLVVKSHPHGNKKISKALKKAKIDNVKFVDATYDPIDLIANASAVITGASHSFSDALLYFKKLIILGDNSFVFSYVDGPFLRVKSLRDLKLIHQYLKSDNKPDEILRLFFIIQTGINDEYFFLENFKERFEKNREILGNMKAIEIILNYYQSKLNEG